MLRGRHRGLPVAIDRAVMLPHEFRDRTPEEAQEGSTISGQSGHLSRASSGSGLGGRECSVLAEERDVTEPSAPIDSEK